MIPRISSVKSLSSFFLEVIFDDGKKCIYDVEEDIKQIKSYEDLPRDTIYEYGKVV